MLLQQRITYEMLAKHERRHRGCNVFVVAHEFDLNPSFFGFSPVPLLVRVQVLEFLDNGILSAYDGVEYLGRCG